MRFHLDSTIGGSFVRRPMASRGWTLFPSSGWFPLLIYFGLLRASSCMLRGGPRVFAIQAEGATGCLGASTSVTNGVKAYACRPEVEAQRWMWVSQHRLFNLGTRRCLGVNGSFTLQKGADTLTPVELFECNVEESVLRWSCRSPRVIESPQRGQLWLNTIDGTLQLAPGNGSSFRVEGSKDNLCARPYYVMYTIQGNSHGQPCVFPFKYDHKWYHNCTEDGRDDKHLWCATSSDYDKDELWGFCPVVLNDCSVFWDNDPVTRTCYQFNVNALLPWYKARISCQQQGADLLSIAEMHEQTYITGFLSSYGEVLWSGLNDLDYDGGWQWSDESPLKFINWADEIPTVSGMNRCGVVQSEEYSKWQVRDCSETLPYICKRKLNESLDLQPVENWKKKRTDCLPGWRGFHGNCYQQQQRMNSTWQEALMACRKEGAELTSVNSFGELELLVRHIVNNPNIKVWIGLNSLKNQMEFEWSDFTAVTITPWHSDEPNNKSSELCVAMWGLEGRWSTLPCTTQLSYVCKHPGTVKRGGGDSACQEGWQSHDSRCYLLGNEKMSIRQAADKCRSERAILLTIADRFEQAFVNLLLQTRQAGEEFWLGLRSRSGLFEWQNGNDVSYTNWNRDQPAHRSGCVVMLTGSTTGLWEMRDCSSLLAKYICKQELLPVKPGPSGVTPTASSHVQACTDGWDSYFEHPFCYQIFHFSNLERRKTWQEAETLCQEVGAHLVSVRGPEEALRLSLLLRSRVGHSLEHREHWVWLGLNSRNPQSFRTWRWSDGSFFHFSQFEESGHQADDDGVRNCVALSVRRSQWRRFQCEDRLDWICKRPRGTESNDTAISVSRRERWLQFDGTDYLFADHPLAWSLARFTCAWMGSEHVSIHSEAEADFLLKNIQKFYGMGMKQWWTGLHTPARDRELQWSDGSELEYVAWQPKQPNIAGKTDVCVYVSAHNGTWGAQSCGKKYPFVCKRPDLKKPSARPAVSAYATCPDNWKVLGDKCLGFFDDPKQAMTWVDAMNYCQNMDAVLATIDNHLQQAFLMVNMDLISKGYWIGLYRAANGHVYRWLQDVNVTYTNWAPGQPSAPWEKPTSTQMFEHCAMVWNGPPATFTGKWDDRACNQEKHAFICQLYKNPVLPSPSIFPDPRVVDTLSFSNTTYHLLRSMASWHEAAWMCKHRGAIIVAITDPRHQAFLTLVAHQLDTSVWIGLYSSAEDTERGFHWFQKDHVPYTRWKVGEPKQNPGCVYLDPQGWWRTADCDLRLKGAICSISHDIALDRRAGHCPRPVNDSAWVAFRSSCYSFHVRRRLSGESAQSLCYEVDPNAQVASIADEHENYFIWEHLQAYDHTIGGGVWLGLFFNTDNDQLSWSDGSPMKYTNWAPHWGEVKPDNVDTCVWMRQMTGQWSRTTCDKTGRRGVVCELPRDKGDDQQDKSHVKYEAFRHGRMIEIIVIVVTAICLVTAIALFWCKYRRRRTGSRGASFENALYCRNGSGSRRQDGHNRNLLVSDTEAE
uniref:C-type mannose receptor 2 n=1 Tax=Myxine glutinosa TaxID=7769 RepID=UPI00358E0A76